MRGNKKEYRIEKVMCTHIIVIKSSFIHPHSVKFMSECIIIITIIVSYISLSSINWRTLIEQYYIVDYIHDDVFPFDCIYCHYSWNVIKFFEEQQTMDMVDIWLAIKTCSWILSASWMTFKGHSITRVCNNIK